MTLIILLDMIVITFGIPFLIAVDVWLMKQVLELRARTKELDKQINNKSG